MSKYENVALVMRLRGYMLIILGSDIYCFMKNGDHLNIDDVIFVMVMTVIISLITFSASFFIVPIDTPQRNILTTGSIY